MCQASVEEMAIRLDLAGVLWLALGATNKHFTRDALGHDPSNDEAIRHFYFHTGPYYETHFYEVSADEPGNRTAEVPETGAQAA